MHELQRTSRRVGLTVLVSVHACVHVRVCACVCVCARARARDAEKLEARFKTLALTLPSLRWERDRLRASCRPGYRALCTRCAGPSSQVPATLLLHVFRLPRLIFAPVELRNSTIIQGTLETIDYQNKCGPSPLPAPSLSRLSLVSPSKMPHFTTRL